MDITKLSAMEMRQKLKNKEISSRDIVNAHIDRIDEVDDELNAFITVTKEEALNIASEIDRKIMHGEELGMLAGIPIAIKDNIITNGIKTTCGSKMLENFIPPYDSTAIERIRKEDGIIMGKANMDEFAMGSLTDTSYFGPTKNPINTTKSPGGSSGGSIVAVKSREVALSLGSDTGGSVRQPASYCGVVGIKPTYGLISRYGLVAVANSMDQIGVSGRSVEDAVLMLEAIAGHDIKDSTCADIGNINYLGLLNEDIRGMKVGLPVEYFNLDMDCRIKDKVMDAVKVFERLGAEIEEISLPNANYALETYYVLATSEISANFSRFDGVRYGYRAEKYDTLDELYMETRSQAFGSEVKRRIIAGTYFLSSKHAEDYYRKALKVRTLIRKDFDKAFEKYDIILSPTTPNLPFALSEENNPLTMATSDIFTVAVNLAGICAMSLPCGYIDGLPVGLQIMGDRFKEVNMLKAGYAFEKYLSIGGDKHDF